MNGTLTGVVVGRTDLGERDRVVRFLTAEEGRVDLVARGARSSTRRFGGLLELGNRVRVEPIGRRDTLRRVGTVELLGAVDRARSDLERIAFLTYGCEAVAALAGNAIPAPRLTRLLVVWLELLEMDVPIGPSSRLALEGKALTFAGLLPDLHRCARCGEPLTRPAVFHPESGALHGDCGRGEDVDPSYLHHLDALRRTPLFETPGLESPGGWLLADVIAFHARRPLRSRPLLAGLEEPIPTIR